jgi:hypothetical protein
MLVAAGGPHVHDAEAAVARGWRDAEQSRCSMVSPMNTGAEAHVDVFEIGPGVLRDVLDA